jgi:hypothetical protein
MARRKIEQELPVEKIGAEIRSMMTWNREIEV